MKKLRLALLIAGAFCALAAASAPTLIQLIAQGCYENAEKARSLVIQLDAWVAAGADPAQVQRLRDYFQARAECWHDAGDYVLSSAGFSVPPLAFSADLNNPIGPTASR